MSGLKVFSENEFKRSFNEVATVHHAVMRSKGFWDTRDDGIPLDHEFAKATKLALIHSEVSECLEAVRKPDAAKSAIEGFTNEEEELADVILRIMDYAEGYGLDVAAAVVAKIARNEERERMHGGKKF